ncbi:MAG: CocE/NonD family hydrolase [Trueperaceae bacterium]|nr:CocE/NonD family hydrolase [Trueperaceae bacterium]
MEAEATLTFNHYRSGVYEGQFVFGEKELRWLAVDLRTRVQLKTIPFERGMKESLFDLPALHADFGVFRAADWNGDTVTLPDGTRYNRYLTFEGTVSGAPTTGQLWARRGEPPIMDVVTVDGAVVAFIMPGRVSSEMLILDGYESVTPFTKYADPNLSPVEYGIAPLGNQLVRTRDGVDLATEVFLPAGAAGGQRFPTIVVRTCYGKARELNRCTHWVNRGYAVVVQDVRGRSDSGGKLVPFYYEREDARDLFDWIARQDWSDGAIGMWGASYLGYTTTAAATTGHPNLKTAISEVNVGSPFFYDTVRRGGAVCAWPLLCWTLGQSVSNRTDFEVFGGKSVNPDEVVRMRPLLDIPSQAIGKRSEPWDMWAEHYQYDEFWRHCDNGEHAENIRVPMLILSGWHDGDALGVQETWRFLTKHDVPGRRIIIGPWPHALNAFRDCQTLAYGDNAIDYDFDTRTIRWFDRYLKGVDNGEDRQPRTSYYLGIANEWRTSDDWNPTEAKLVELYLDSDGSANSMHGDGRLVRSPVSGDRSDSYVYDPDNVATGDGQFLPSVLNPQQSRQDYLVYNTPVLTEDVAVAGNLSARFFAASSTVDTDFFVTVSDVDEDGVARKVSTNGIRAEFRQWPAVASAPLTPGSVEEYELYLHFAGHVFEAGHKIRVDICSADYITFFPNSNTGIDPFTDPKPLVARQRVHHGSERPSCVRLPVLYGEVPDR